MGDEPSRYEPLKWFPEHERALWFQERYEDAANEVIEYFGGDFISLTGREVADVGCGDGILDLGVAHKALPSRMVGFDTRPTDAGLLLRLAREEGVADELPSTLEFRTCEHDLLPAGDGSFDAVYSWSTFDHVEDPVRLVQEIRRVLRPEGHLMVQVYPFFHSQHGSHLAQWYPEGFAQLRHDKPAIEARLRSDPGADPEWAEHLLQTYRHLNKLTLDGLQSALRLGGFVITRFQLLAEDVRLPVEIAGLPLSLVGVGGVKLLARPAQT